jgi:hypothetical protein
MEALVVRDPLAGVGLEHLRRKVDDALHVAVGKRADRTIGHEATDEGAVVAVKDDFIADLGQVAGTDESGRLSRGNAQAN